MRKRANSALITGIGGYILLLVFNVVIFHDRLNRRIGVGRLKRRIVTVAVPSSCKFGAEYSDKSRIFRTLGGAILDYILVIKP